MLSHVPLLGLYLISQAGLIAWAFDFSVYPLCAQPALQNNALVSCDYGLDQVDITLTAESYIYRSNCGDTFKS
jgi:hypothetical protein